MNQDLCKLTLVYPAPAEDKIVDFFLDARRALEGCTSLRAEGHCMDFGQSSVRERVRGRIERNMLIVVLRRAQLKGLLDDLRAQAAVPDLVYWVEPVEDYGRLG